MSDMYLRLFLDGSMKSYQDIEFLFELRGYSYLEKYVNALSSSDEKKATEALRIMVRVALGREITPLERDCDALQCRLDWMKFMDTKKI